jgi:isopentenyl-diphosphate Delta-isomerase
MTLGRKDEHLAAAVRPAALHAGPTGLRAFRLRHRALPGHDLAEVDLESQLLGVRLRAPFLVASMTGGTERARAINERLAAAAEQHGVGMGLGSGRAVLEDASLLPAYRTRARPPLLLANLGAVQLRRGIGPADIERLVGLLGADGVILHLNPLQEAIQPGGDTTFAGLGDAIRRVVERLAPRPVVVKEVGFGLDPDDVAQLVEAGVAAVDVAGAGGTNWASVEADRAPDRARTAAAFRDWGWPTAAAIRNAVAGTEGTRVGVIASGGISDGVEAATALALGACAVSVARPLLLAAIEDRAGDAIAIFLEQLRIATWLTGHVRPRELALDDLAPA